MSAAQFRKWLAVGTGVGIEICGDDLVVSVVRVRPNSVHVVSSFTIDRFRERPAGEWGAEYATAMKAAGTAHLAATVLLPRGEIIVRSLSFPGVKGRDLDAAVRFQADTLHPYPEDEVGLAWTRVAQTSTVLVGIARKQTIEQYAVLFTEAGVRVTSFTFSAPVLYSAIRVFEPPPADGFLVLSNGDAGLEAYGESPVRPIFSATFDLPADRVLPLALAELRLDPETKPITLLDLLPLPEMAPEDWNFDHAVLSYATALTAACSWLALSANLLPASYRSKSSRAFYIPTAALAALLLIAVGVLVTYGGIENHRYLSELETEIARYTPEAGKVADLNGKMKALRRRRELLREFRLRTKADLDALRELTRILPPPIWLKSLQLTRTTATLNGEAPQAADLLGLIDKSPLFRNSEFTSPISRVGEAETFSIRTQREVVNPGEGE